MESATHQSRFPQRFPTRWLAGSAVATTSVLLVLLLYSSTTVISWDSIILDRTTTSTTSTTTSSRRLFGLPTPSLLDGEPFHLFPLTRRDIIGLSIAALGLLVAAGGGIGGGGFLVPIYILILRFAPKHAIPLSNVTVFGGAVANTLLNLPKRHPLVDRPLIDWDIMILMEPLTVAGAIVGANLNKVLPEAVIVVLLDILLLLMAHKTLQDAIHIYEKESDELCHDHAPTNHETVKTKVETNGSSEKSNLTGDSAVYGTLPAGGEPSDIESSEPLVENQKAILDKILTEEGHVPLWNVNLIVGMFLVILTVNVLKGGGSFPSPLGIKCGSKSFWFAQAFLLATTVAAFLYARVHVLEKTRLKDRAKYVSLPCDIQWNERSTIIFPLLSALSGLIAGMFGLGGGIVKGPLMLALGVHPAVTSATAACMILFTSFTATSAFAVFGLLVPEYAATLALLGFLATFAGQTIMNYLLHKYHRQSFIAFSIEIVVAVSAVAMTVESVVKIAKGASAEPRGICS